jgi:hypothetical protein
MKMLTPNTARPQQPRTPSGDEPAYLHPMIQEHLLAERALERWKVEQEKQTTPAATSNSATQSTKITKIIGDERHVITTKVLADGRKVTNTRVFELTREERQQHNGVGQMSSKLPPGGTSNPETSNAVISDVDRRRYLSIQEDILARAKLQKQRGASEWQRQAPLAPKSTGTNNPELPAVERLRQQTASAVAKNPELLHPYLQEHYLAEQALREQEEQQKEENMLKEVKRKEEEDPGQLHPYLQEHYFALEEKPKFQTSTASSSQPLMQGYQADTALARRRMQKEEEQIISDHEKKPSVKKKVKKRGGLLGRRKKDKTPTQEQRGNSPPPQNLHWTRETTTTHVPDKQGEDKRKEKPKKSGLFGRSTKKVKPPTQEQEVNSEKRGKGKPIHRSRQHRSAPPTNDAGDDREASDAWENLESQPKLQQYLLESYMESREIGMVASATEGRPRPEVEEFLKLQGTALNSIQQQKRPDQPAPHREARASLPTKQQYVSPSNTTGLRQTPSPNMQMASQGPGQGWENIVTDDLPQKSKRTQNMGMHAVKEQQEYCGDSYSGSRSTRSEQTPEASIEEEDDYDRPPITEHIVRHTAMSEVTNPVELYLDQQDGYDSMSDEHSDEHSDAELSYDPRDYVDDDEWEALEKDMEKGESGPSQTPSFNMQMSSHGPKSTAVASMRNELNPNIHALSAAPRHDPTRASSFTPGQVGEDTITDDVPQKPKRTQNMGMHAVKEQQEYRGDSYSRSRSTKSEQTPEGSIEEEDDRNRPPITEHIVRHTAMSEVTNPWELRQDQQDGYDSKTDENSEAELSYASMDYVDDDEWERLEKAMQNGGPEATRQWEAFLKSQGIQSERDPEEQEQQRSLEHVPRQQQIDVEEERNPASHKVSEAQSESTTGIQTTFICACCHGSKRTKESGYSCDNLQSPHLVCSDCVRQYLWSTKDTRAPYGMLGSHAKPICQLPCFTSLDGRSSCHCSFKIHVQLRNLFDSQELEEWVVREQELFQMQVMAPESPLPATQQQTRVAATGDRAVPLGPKQQIEVAMKEAATNARVRSCATCNQALNKSQNGCNAMKCLVCQTVSCHVCRQVVPPGGYDTHFDMFGDDNSKCPLMTDAETDRKSEEEDMKRDIMALANQVLEDYKYNK